MERKFSAYPLFVKDPAFSIWANREHINESNPIFWAGNPKIVNGYILVNEKKYFFLGKGDGALVQTDIKTEGFQTICTYTCAAFDLTVRFVSPLFPDDLEQLSRPVCYLVYDVKPKRKLENAFICFEMEERLCYDTLDNEQRKEETVGCVTAFSGFECAVIGLKQQTPLSVTCDLHIPDCGYWYVSGETCAVEEREGRKYACGTNALSEHGFFMLGFDDIVSINYFGTPLVGYYFRNGKTICDAMQEAFESAEDTFARCERAYEEYKKEWAQLGEDYVLLCNAALVQSIGAHKLVQDYLTGEVLFLSYECGSGACMATPDVSYPSSPLFVKYNPELLRGMLRPVFTFARKKVWKYRFAPHDVGVYPLAYGQYYALMGNGVHKYAKNICTDSNEIYTALKVFADENRDYYDFNRQMPVEECSNMLILTYAAYRADGKSYLMQKEFDLLTLWADYLKENGNAFQNQLTSDDFCGRKENNVNLAIKAAIGLRAYAEICKVLRRDGAVYLKKAQEMANIVTECGRKYKHLPSSFDLSDETYSLKYNLAFDKLFGFGLFGEELYKKEADCYAKNLSKYGVRLYSDINSTKSDWLAFVACFSENETHRKTIFSAITRFMRETAHRVPFPDWYDVADSKKAEESLFRNRSVQGGIFMPLLIGLNKK